MNNKTAPERGLIISVGDSRKSTNWKAKEVTWKALTKRLRSCQRTSETVEQFAAMTSEERADIKDVGGFIGGTVRNGSRKASDVDFRGVLTLDADYADSSFWTSYTQLCEYTACLYSTHSHREGHQRYRLIIPMTKAVDPLQYEAVARMVAREIGIDQFDDTTYEPNRLMYWPSAPIDGEFVYEEQDGEWLDPDEVLSRYHDWHDRSSWPQSSRSTRDLTKRLEHMGNPGEKPGLIGAFCRVYDIPAAIDTYLPEVYTPAGEGRYTYANGSAYGGMKTFDNDTYMYSWHSTDPVMGKELNAFDMVRLHLFGEMDKDLPANTEMSDLPSYAAMRELCSRDVDVMKEYQAGRSPDADMIDRCFANMYADQDIAKFIADKYHGLFCYNPSIGWLAYDGKVWQQGADDLVQSVVMRTNNELLDDIHAQLSFCDDEEQEKVLKERMKRIVSLRSSGRIKGVVSLLQAFMYLRNISALNPDGDLLNTPDFVLNLKTGERIPHSPQLMCSHMTAVTPEPGEAPRWRKFLTDVTQGDAELEKYVQTVCGMALFGKVINDGMIMVYGPGGNGKSTMFGTVQELLGDYATTMRSDIIIQKANGAEPYGIEECMGRRMILMGETDEGARFSVSVLKRLTSRDEIQANPKHKQPFAFTPTHTTILHTNHMPRLGQLDEGTKRRITVVPFLCPRKEGKERIANLKELLIEEEGPQILQWCVEGALRFHQLVELNGGDIPQPDVVKQTTDNYLLGEDWLRQFIEDKCVTGKGKSCSAAALYNEYKAWAGENNDYIRRSSVFKTELEGRGYENRKTMKGRMWYGITPEEDEV